MGSTKGQSPRHPLLRIIPAASTSLMGGFGLRLAPAALVERFARRVERQSDTVAVDVDVDHDIGIVETDTGSLVRTETVFE